MATITIQNAPAKKQIPYSDCVVVDRQNLHDSLPRIKDLFLKNS